MITAHFEWKKLIINLENLDKSYLWKEIAFSLMYWIDILDWANDYYTKQWEVRFTFNWQKEVYIEVDEIKPWYRWENIWIGYYIEADLWKKMLIFRDTKEINISWREDSVFYAKDLENVKSWEYIWYIDKKNYKKIFNKIFENFFNDFIGIVKSWWILIYFYWWNCLF